METLVHTASMMSAAAVSSLVSAIWEGSVLSLCVVVCLRLSPRLSAASRSLIWMNVFLLLLLLNVVPSFFSKQDAVSMAHRWLTRRWAFAVLFVAAPASAVRADPAAEPSATSTSAR